MANKNKTKEQLEQKIKELSNRLGKSILFRLSHAPGFLNGRSLIKICLGEENNLKIGIAKATAELERRNSKDSKQLETK